MKILLDECVTRYLKRDLATHEVFTVEEAGFKGLKNGRLLQAASEQYDVLVTVDQNLTYQQNLKSFRIAVVVLTAKRSTYPFLRPLMTRVLDELDKIKAGDVVVVKA
jgi:predicted nuclease of predicted toxin-antitoxin system